MRDRERWINHIKDALRCVGQELRDFIKKLYEYGTMEPESSIKLVRSLHRKEILAMFASLEDG